ncbi:hypothetical protein, partial [Klebsiella pneumoniae]|uniref:hypothetical protein n=1 Tax=Klebsiella pneumoniae TaxID=573 RepID=UPI00396AA7D9
AIAHLTIGIPEHVFEEDAKGKKVGYQLLKTITSNTGFVEVPITFKDRKIKLKLVLNIDIPTSIHLHFKSITQLDIGV